MAGAGYLVHQGSILAEPHIQQDYGNASTDRVYYTWTIKNVFGSFMLGSPHDFANQQNADSSTPIWQIRGAVSSTPITSNVKSAPFLSSKLEIYSLLLVFSE